MNVQEIEVNKLTPYSKNARKNKNAVPYVKRSIEQFGFKVPIIIDENYVVVCGHTRLLAAKELGLETVPCVIAYDLSPEQIKAFRLADNKVSEKAEWDFDLLQNELEEITEINMFDFGFEVDIPEEEAERQEDEDEEKENERLRTDEAYLLQLVNIDDCVGWYQMPKLERCDVIPKELIGFNYMLSTDKYETGIHFFVDDYQFERVWNDPFKYVDRMSLFNVLLTPDFSLYLDMPRSMKIWNVYRSRLLGYYWQSLGFNVIPTVQWAEPETFDFCFDGLPTNAILAVSSIGVKRDEEALNIWKLGMEAMIERLHPKMILLYGGYIEDFDYRGIEVKCYSNEVTEKMKKIKK